MTAKYFDGSVPEPSEYTDADLAIQKLVADSAANADAAIERFRIDQAIAEVWRIVDALNGYITEQEPWVLAKDDSQRERLATVIYTCLEGLRALAVLLSPVMPDSTAKLWEGLGIEGALAEQNLREAGAWGVLQPGTATTKLAPLFPRIDEE
jgi:methionyl-tRNA synthetase